MLFVGQSKSRLLVYKFACLLAFALLTRESSSQWIGITVGADPILIEFATSLEFGGKIFADLIDNAGTNVETCGKWNAGSGSR